VARITQHHEFVERRSMPVIFHDARTKSRNASLLEALSTVMVISGGHRSEEPD